LDAFLNIQAYADARAVLEALRRARRPAAILSNGSPRMLDAAVTASGMAQLFDAVLSVDAVRAYKPRPEVYALVTAQFAIEPGDAAFVSSNRWDVMGAAAFGFRPFWVNRAKMPDEYAEAPPLHVVADLSALPSIAA
jgi:2-haloacid dehalogenase